MSDTVTFPARMAEAEFKKIHAETSLEIAKQRVVISDAQAEISRQELRLNEAAYRLVTPTADAPAP